MIIQQESCNMVAQLSLLQMDHDLWQMQEAAGLKHTDVIN